MAEHTSTAAVVHIRVQEENFDTGSENNRLTDGRTDIGAIVSFTGLCRAEGGRLEALELEHYPGMAEAEMERIAQEAIERWQLLAVSIIHRYGKIPAGENIVFVGAAAPHRKAAFAAGDFIMDFLKSRAPFWKKEHMVDGKSGDWVDAKEADEEALNRWTKT